MRSEQNNARLASIQVISVHHPAACLVVRFSNSKNLSKRKAAFLSEVEKACCYIQVHKFSIHSPTTPSNHEEPEEVTNKIVVPFYLRRGQFGERRAPIDVILLKVFFSPCTYCMCTQSELKLCRNVFCVVSCTSNSAIFLVHSCSVACWGAVVLFLPLHDPTAVKNSDGQVG